ncbi:hypothetical protein B0T16DRAFT_395495 [Cercophora newfieldiana]|uniref:Uncharacterized protein n=1 Tax=Cercophora newfieldiana TaxID=92897 RepID=A0AA39XTA5_9PEZI|nr:hypothetical protein B0T16DRAFT_395495 [Cercophora newfieldiana]
MAAVAKGRQGKVPAAASVSIIHSFFPVVKPSSTPVYVVSSARASTTLVPITVNPPAVKSISTNTYTWWMCEKGVVWKVWVWRVDGERGMGRLHHQPREGGDVLIRRQAPSFSTTMRNLTEYQTWYFEDLDRLLQEPNDPICVNNINPWCIIDKKVSWRLMNKQINNTDSPLGVLDTHPPPSSANRQTLPLV